MDKKKFILGAALKVGLDKQKCMKHCGIPSATFELRVMSSVAGMTDEQIVKLVRNK